MRPSNTGKGANTVAGMLHHFFANHSLGESKVHLHADNCVPWAKQKQVPAIWRVIVGLHKSIKLSFLTVGHSPDRKTWCALIQSTSISHLHIQHDPIHLHPMLPHYQSVTEYVVIVAIMAIIREPVKTEKINK